MVFRTGYPGHRRGFLKKWITSSSGWWRSLLVAHTYPHTPPEGSVVERIILAVLEREQKAKVLATKAIMHAAMHDAETAQDVFEQYAGLLLPFMERLKKEEKAQLRKQVEAVGHQTIVLDPALLGSLKGFALKEKK